MPVDTVLPVPNFETFRRTSARPEGPSVTLTQRGQLNLSAAAVTLLGTPDHVRLLWDRQARILGIQPASEGDADALRLSVSRGIGTRTVAAKAFADWAGIPLGAAEQWQAYLEGGVLCADLSQRGRAVSSNRARRRIHPGDDGV